MSNENTTDSPSDETPDLPSEAVVDAPLSTVEVIGETPVAAKEAEGGSIPDVSPESVGAALPIAPDVKESRASVLSQTATRATPSAPEHAGKHAECRSEPRIHVRWHADAIIDGQDVCHGFIRDISLNGADILLDHSLQHVKFVKLHICLPPLNVIDNPHVVEVSGKVVHIVYDGNESYFRTGINFLKFNLESDLAYLKSRILSRVSATMGS